MLDPRAVTSPRSLFTVMAVMMPVSTRCGSLWQGFEDGVHLLGDCRQRKLKLVLVQRGEEVTEHDGQVTNGLALKKQQTDEISAGTVPWCEPSLVSGPGCAQEWRRCRSLSHLETSEDKRYSEDEEMMEDQEPEI